MHRKNLAKRINTMLTILLLLLLIPLFLTIFCQKMQLEKLLGNVNRTAEKEEDADMLFCIVAKEISADAPEECIKAQCVIARTNLKAAEEMGTELPGSMTMGELQELWGDYFSEAEGKIKEAIQETDGETLQYRNHYIYAAYHAVSAGNTRNMEELYPDSDMPYLSGAACYEDAQAPDYLSVLYLDQEITIGGWERSIRDSKTFGFIVVNDGTYFQPLQVVYSDKLDNFAEISKMNVGAAIIVKGTLVATPQAKQPFEIQAEEVQIEGASAPDYPLQKKRHSFEYLREIPHIRPRANTYYAVFRLRSVLSMAIHEFFQDQGFV